MISESHNFIFIHVPKTGGNAVSQALLPFTRCRIEPAASIRPGENFWVTHPDYGIVKHLTAEQYGLIVDVSHYTMFATVRNPFDWAMSLYFFRKQTPGLQPAWMSVDPRSYCKREFLAFLKSGEASQSLFLGSLRDRIHLMRFDCLEDDFREICGRLNLGDVTLTRINASDRPRDLSILDAEVMAEISFRFAADVDLYEMAVANHHRTLNIANQKECENVMRPS